MRDNEGNELTVSAGESILLPATTQDITITPEGGNVKLLKHTYKRLLYRIKVIRLCSILVMDKAG